MLLVQDLKALEKELQAKEAELKKKEQVLFILFYNLFVSDR